MSLKDISTLLLCSIFYSSYGLGMESEPNSVAAEHSHDHSLPPARSQLQTLNTHRPVPELKLQSIDNNSEGISASYDRPVLLHFWADYCPPCIRELPALNQLAKRYTDELQVVTVAVETSPDSVSQLAALLQLDQLQQTVLQGEQWPPEIFIVEVLPVTLFINIKGDITARAIGEVHWMGEAELRTLERLLKAE
jgi:thiol-disulfide isomerase/thioredoxin